MNSKKKQSSQKFSKKKSVSQSTQNALKRIEMQKKITPMTDYKPSGVVQSPSGEAQPFLPHVTPRAPRSVHAKFHANWTKTVGARGIHTDRQTDRQSSFYYIDTQVGRTYCDTNCQLL